jgi:hypothetical protein
MTRAIRLFICQCVQHKDAASIATITFCLLETVGIHDKGRYPMVIFKNGKESYLVRSCQI